MWAVTFFGGGVLGWIKKTKLAGERAPGSRTFRDLAEDPSSLLGTHL